MKYIRKIINKLNKKDKNLGSPLGRGVIVSTTIREATCQQPGIEHRRNIDNKKEGEFETPIMPHCYENGICVWCGRKEER